MFRRNERLFLRYRQTRDPRALGLVSDRTAPELLRVARHLTEDPHRAEDLVQATFLTAMERAGQYDTRRPLLPWLLAILANRARAWYRREKQAQTKPETLGDDGVTARDDVVKQAANRELAEECDRALDGLPEPYRHVLILHLRHHLSGVEISRALDRPDSTVRNQIARGLNLLRKSLPAWTTPAVALTTTVTTTGRGLAAVRRTVLARASAEAGVVGAGVAGTSLLVLGGVSMGSKVPALAVVMVGSALLGGGAWYMQLGSAVETLEKTVAGSGSLRGDVSAKALAVGRAGDRLSWSGVARSGRSVLSM